MIEELQASSSSSEKVSTISLSTSTSQNREESGEEYKPTCKKTKSDYISLDTKIKILNMVREHPNWSLKTIKKMKVLRLKIKAI